MQSVQLRTPAVLGSILLFTSLVLGESSPAEGTPVYAARAGRTCDNCHLEPGGWLNPPLPQRKCGLSCQTCHVDPAGGGMRNAAGRFYGRATLPMIATSPRPTEDWDRELIPRLLYRKDRATTYTDDLPRGPATPDESARFVDSVDDRYSLGAPFGAPTPYAALQGRYGVLHADPVLRIGWDIRIAALLSQSTLVFPMQGDLGVRFHPLTHVSLLVNTGWRGRRAGFSAVSEDDLTPYFREAFLILHEAPYQAYVKLGRFTPSYGLRLDDHTSQIRRAFELDGSLPGTRVLGAEIGAAPNFPFINVSCFGMASRDREPSAFDVFDVDRGWGTALNAGIRHLGWGIGASALLRRRPVGEGGDTSTFGLYGIFNPWFYKARLPIVYLAEFDGGRRSRESGSGTGQLAFYQELDWLVANGVNLLFAHDFADPDREVRDDEAHRLSSGLQITPYPGFTLDVRERLLLPAGGESGYDTFVQIHLWN